MISDLVHEIGRVKKSGANKYPATPIEKEYPVSNELFVNLGCEKEA